jgi:hypothetical protein
MKQKRCLLCRAWFDPYPPQAARQKICGLLKCKRQLKRRTDRAWRRRDPQWRKDLNAKHRIWARNFPNYWRYYRGAHPAYVAGDNQRRVQGRRRVSAKQDR